MDEDCVCQADWHAAGAGHVNHACSEAISSRTSCKLQMEGTAAFTKLSCHRPVPLGPRKILTTPTFTPMQLLLLCSSRDDPFVVSAERA